VGSVALYLAGWLGAGDSKLFAAAALFAGLGNLLLLVVATALAGGLYALAVLLIRPREVFRGMTARGRKEGRLRGIPYGVAIAAGALVTALLTQNVQAGDHLAHINSGSKPAPAANAK
jgi:prepilin peptidase CpaA